MNPLFRILGVTGLSLLSTGCAQLGFFSTDFFDRGPVQQLSCSEVGSTDPAADAGNKVRPIDCEILDLGNQNLKEGDYGVAEEKFKQAIEIYTIDEARRSDLRLAWFGLAAVYDNLRRFPDADKAYMNIKSMFGEDFRFYNNYGFSLYLRGQLADAEKQYRSALSLRPNNSKILANLELIDQARSQTPNNTSPDNVSASPDYGAGVGVGGVGVQ